MSTIAKDLLSTRVVVVHPEQRLSDAAPALRQLRAQYCAVVEENTGVFEGIVRLGDAAALSNSGSRIFADLSGGTPWIRVDEGTPAEGILTHLSDDRDAVLVVLTRDDHYIGTITMESVWGWLVQSQALQQRLLEQVFEEQRLLSDFLEKKVEQRTTSLRVALEEFRSSSVQLSHDVGGPLRTIKSFVEMLANGECGVLNEEGRIYVDRIFRAATKVEALAVEILGRAREAGRAAPAPLHTVDLNEVMADAIELSHALLQERDALVMQRDVLHAVSGRYVPLLQIMSNLLVNAVKYVPENRRPEVEIWSEESEGRVLLRVKDNGRGIGSADAETVFQPFVRLGDDRTEGTGLGLSITRDAVRDLGGNIRFESREGVGSVFTVVLQVARNLNAVP
ncbi:MAG: domain protein S-box [Rariglobus sp.]|jgi:signal transduction histidine kinase|nr:domain protein S-box [Rariglobus sp.]